MEQETYGYDTFLSPFTWRYRSQESGGGNGLGADKRMRGRRLSANRSTELTTKSVL